MRRLIGWMAVVAVGFLSLLLSGCTRTAPNPKGAASSEPAAAETANAIDQATGLALQGDTAAAVKILAAIPEDRFQGDDANFRACMEFHTRPMAAYGNSTCVKRCHQLKR